MKPLILFAFILVPSLLFSQEVLDNSIDLSFEEPQFSFANTDELQLDDLSLTSTPIVEVSNSRTCWCVVSYLNLTSKHESPGVCKYLTIDKKYPMIITNKNSRDCNSQCTAKAKKLTEQERQEIAQCACTNLNKAANSLGINTGSGGVKIEITAFSKISSRPYVSAHGLGTLQSKSAQYETKWTCPNGWKVDDGQSDPNRKCKKASCKLPGLISDRELPNLPGFVWNNTIYQWIKGDKETVVTSPARCELVK